MVGRLVEISQILLPGTYAWAMTVVPAATSQQAPLAARAAAFLAFVALVAGAFVVKDRPRIGHLLGIWTFLAFCLIAWLSNINVLDVARLEPVRAAAGALGWLLFALGWGTPWRAESHPEDNPLAQLHPKLEPRAPALARRHAIVAVGVVSGFCCLALAWLATEPARAMLMHGAALASGVALVSASASIALAQEQRRSTYRSKQRLGFVLPWLFALVALLVIALAWRLAR